MSLDFKNFESLATTGKLKFFTSQDFFSYTGDRKKIIQLATITGRLSTILRYSFTDKDIIQSFGYLLVDLFARNYPKKVYTYLYNTYPQKKPKNIAYKPFYTGSYITI